MLVLQKDELNKSEIIKPYTITVYQAKIFYGARTIHKLQSGLPRETPWEGNVPDKAFVMTQVSSLMYSTQW